MHKILFHLKIIVLILCFASKLTGEQLPVLSIITSIYNGDRFIEYFLDDIVKQTIFKDCELILINAASPGNEEPIILDYLNRYPNIIYKKLEKDPGIYAVWNIGIQLSRGEFITNANLDDRLAHNCHETFLKSLQQNPNVDLVYSDAYITHFPNENFENNQHHTRSNLPEFSKETIKQHCLPNAHPMWRKSMHTKYGYFDEKFKHSGDWEMWLRAAKQGAIFSKIHGIYALHFANPRGLSVSNSENKETLIKEHKIIFDNYLCK